MPAGEEARLRAFLAAANDNTHTHSFRTQSLSVHSPNVGATGFYRENPGSLNRRRRRTGPHAGSVPSSWLRSITCITRGSQRPSASDYDTWLPLAHGGAQPSGERCRTVDYALRRQSALCLLFVGRIPALGRQLPQNLLYNPDRRDRGRPSLRGRPTRWRQSHTDVEPGWQRVSMATVVSTAGDARHPGHRLRHPLRIRHLRQRYGTAIR